MSECEVCGCQVKGEPILVQIGGAKMWVCPKCAKLGTEIKRPPHAVPPGARPATGKAAPQQRRRPRDVFDMMQGEVVENFGELVREARMEKGWSQKDLALDIKEKENLIKKIETGFMPEDDVLKKIEKSLEITLIESMDTDIQKGKGSAMKTTLGDVITIKKSKK